MADRVVLRIGHYRLGRTLGVGSFGKVKLAHHELTGHQVAVKIINKAKVKMMDMDDKIRREIQILKLFYHPHIIRLYEVIDTATDIFMVMEYVSGGELFEYIVTHGKISENKARKFIQQIVCGVEYCHLYGVVHRDLKPENLLLDSRNHVRISDFGLANILRDGDFLKTSCGSPNYAAPEVISGKLYAGPEVDVWSVGVILYALLCGKLPFDDEYIPALFKKIKDGKFHMPGHLSPGAIHIISRCLVVDPLQRATIAEIKQNQWFQTNIPTYLQADPFSHSRDFKNVDEVLLREVLEKMVETNFDKAIEDLKHGVMNKVTVCYHLMVDHKLRLELSKQRKSQKITQSKHPDSDSVGSPAHIPSSPDGGLFSTTPPMLNVQDRMDKGSVDTSELVKEPSHYITRPRQRWYLGIASGMKPHEVMREVCRVLKSLNYEWMNITCFDLCVRPKQQDPLVDVPADFPFASPKTPIETQLPLDPVVSPPVSPHPVSPSSPSSPSKRKRDLNVKLRLRLFQVSPERLVLDFQKCDGEIFAFFDVCAELIDNLDV